MDILMNSKLDHYAPAVGRMVMEREVAGRGRGEKGPAGRRVDRRGVDKRYLRQNSFKTTCRLGILYNQR